MKRKIMAACAAALLVGTLGACTGNNFRDVEGVDSHDADEYTLFNNVDGHPNIVRVCADGVAFATTTREYTSVLRVPEWDAHCAEVQR